MSILCTHLYSHPSLWQQIQYLSIFLSICLSTHLHVLFVVLLAANTPSIHLFICLSIYFRACPYPLPWWWTSGWVMAGTRRDRCGPWVAQHRWGAVWGPSAHETPPIAPRWRYARVKPMTGPRSWLGEGWGVRREGWVGKNKGGVRVRGEGWGVTNMFGWTSEAWGMRCVCVCVCACVILCSVADPG